MTAFVCSLIVPARILSFTAATRASRSAVAGTSASRSTVAPGSRRGGVHAAVGGIVGDEAGAELAAHVVHRGRAVGEERQQAQRFVFAVARRKVDAEDGLRPAIVRPVVELEPAAAGWRGDAPAGE